MQCFGIDDVDIRHLLALYILDYIMLCDLPIFEVHVEFLVVRCELHLHDIQSSALQHVWILCILVTIVRLEWPQILIDSAVICTDQDYPELITHANWPGILIGIF